MNRSLGFAILVVAVVATGLFAYLSKSIDQEAKIEVIAANPIITKEAKPSTSIAVPKAKVLPNQPEPPKNNHGRNSELFNSGVLEHEAREFVLKAALSGDMLAKQYARNIALECRPAIAAMNVTQSAQPAVEAVGAESFKAANDALGILQRRCGQFTTEELEMYSSIVLVGTLEAKIRADILKLQNSSDTNTLRKELIKSAVMSGDPLLWDDLGSRLLLWRDGSGVYLSFNARHMYVKDHPEILSALNLVPCYLDLSCSGNTTKMALDCFANGTCYPSRLEAALTREVAGDPKLYDSARSLAQNIAAAIKERRVSSFLTAPNN